MTKLVKLQMPGIRRHEARGMEHVAGSGSRWWVVWQENLFFTTTATKLGKGLSDCRCTEKP
jgi:hypothetical protein